MCQCVSVEPSSGKVGHEDYATVASVGYRAEDPGRLAAFYQEVFELENRGSKRRGASDGAFNLALVQEAEPHKQVLKHLSFETVRVESLGKKLVQAGAQESELIQVDAITGVEFELRDPDGNTVGVCRRAFDVAYEQRPVPIRHIALYTPEAQRMADYYCEVFDMKEVENRPLFDLRFRRLFQLGAFISAQGRADRAQSFRLSRQKQRRNASARRKGRRAPRRGTSGTDSFRRISCPRSRR